MSEDALNVKCMSVLSSYDCLKHSFCVVYNYCWVCIAFFFFLRGEQHTSSFHVNGVQTCALPILDTKRASHRVSPQCDSAHTQRAVLTLSVGMWRRSHYHPPGSCQIAAPCMLRSSKAALSSSRGHVCQCSGCSTVPSAYRAEIGRASCRARV